MLLQAVLTYAHPLICEMLAGMVPSESSCLTSDLRSRRSVHQQPAGNQMRSLVLAAPTVSRSTSRLTAPAMPHRSQSQPQSAGYSGR